MNIKIKQLDWVPMGAVRWEACPPHNYVIRYLDGCYNVLNCGEVIGHPTIEQAKAACQNHFEQRVVRSIEVRTIGEKLIIGLSNGGIVDLTI